MATPPPPPPPQRGGWWRGVAYARLIYTKISRPEAAEAANGLDIFEKKPKFNKRKGLRPLLMYTNLRAKPLNSEQTQD